MPHRPPELRGRIFRARAAIDAGLISARQLQGKAWRRLFQGIYADSSVTITHPHRCAAVFAYLLPADGVIAGRSAAMLHGVGIGRPDDDVEALVPLGTELVPHIGVVVHQGDLRDGECQRVAGLPVTGPVRTCWDLARWLPLTEAVVHIDRLLATGRVTRAALLAYLRQRLDEFPHARGLRRYGRVLSVVDGSAGSPQESRLRVRFVAAGLPTPRSQYVVVDADGAFVARVDLAWPECKVAVEYDGLWHVGSAKQMHDDRRRLNALVSQGWIVLHVTSVRLRDDFDGVLREVRAALRRP